MKTHFREIHEIGDKLIIQKINKNCSKKGNPAIYGCGCYKQMSSYICYI
jgi:hypothetical protein